MIHIDGEIICAILQEDFTRKVDDLVRTLINAERYEAVGPIYRLSIPIFEKNFDFKVNKITRFISILNIICFQTLMSIYAELQQACSRAAEIKINGKRHLGSYFKITFFGQSHFR